MAVLAGELFRQAAMQAVLDAYALVAWSFLAMLPLLLLLRGGALRAPAAMATE